MARSEKEAIEVYEEMKVKIDIGFTNKPNVLRGSGNCGLLAMR